MKKLIILLSMFTILAAGCNTVNNTSADGQSLPIQEETNTGSSSGSSSTSLNESSGTSLSGSSSTSSGGQSEKPVSMIELTSQIQRLDSGLSAVKYEGDYGFDEFLANGGASSDEDVVKYLSQNVLLGAGGFSFGNMPFGCLTIFIRNKSGSTAWII